MLLAWSGHAAPGTSHPRALRPLGTAPADGPVSEGSEITRPRVWHQEGTQGTSVDELERSEAPEEPEGLR